MNSYVARDETVFWKNSYNWHSLPIISPWNFKDPCIFSIKNLGIKFNHFVVGIIREKDIKELKETPWKTEGVVCYESNQDKNDKASWIRYGDHVKIPARTV
jgi:hypothetical protein